MCPERHGETADAAALRARLRHVYWIGGGSGAGKSVTARRVAGRHGLAVYATDDAMAGHGTRRRPRQAPLLSRFTAMDMDERWVSRSPAAMLESFPWFQGELFGLIVDDLLERDHLFTGLLREETKRLGLPAIEVDTAMTEGDLTERVAEAFGL